MSRLTVLICLLASGPLAPLLSPSAQQQPCNLFTSLAECPAEGCGGGDPHLNRKKNRTDEPPNIETRTLGQIRQFSQPSSWPHGQERSSLAAREDRGVMAKGFVARAKLASKETTNCKLAGEENRDVHIDLVSTKTAPLASAVTAEITPRLRKTGWDLDKLDFLADGRFYVRVTGWYPLDTAHISNPITRATNWEIHPVTKFEVCTLTKVKCDQGFGWVPLEDWESPE